MAVEVMDRCGIETTVTLGWGDSFGDTLKRYLEVFNQYEERFIVFGNIDWSRVNEGDFGETASKQIEEGMAMGMRGIKIFKALGLELRKKNGELWEINNPLFDPIWETAPSQCRR